jgi:FkbM family methyltransferase
VRAAIRSITRIVEKDWRLLFRILRRVRAKSLIDVLASFEDGGGQGASNYSIWLKSRCTPLTLRRGSSDFSVFRQVVLEDQYKLDEIKHPKYIVDAGANIGLTSMVFLEQFPDCRVLAIEPDSQNYLIARKNLEVYGDRCLLYQVALWSEEGVVEVQRGVFRDGLDWSCHTVATCERTATAVDARTMNSLLAEVRFPRIDFLKVDIEGAELQVFGEGDTGFLESTKLCATECHDDRCSDTFVQCVKRYGFSVRHEGELAIAWRHSTSDDQVASKCK